jgi:hypothetical protein
MPKRAMFSVTRMDGGKTLHIEGPGCIVNVIGGLRDAEGREVTTVEILANGERFPTEPWWVVRPGENPTGELTDPSLTIRVRRDK